LAPAAAGPAVTAIRPTAPASAGTGQIPGQVAAVGDAAEIGPDRIDVNLSPLLVDDGQRRIVEGARKLHENGGVEEAVRL
jgi:hypothetical protein